MRAVLAKTIFLTQFFKAIFDTTIFYPLCTCVNRNDKGVFFLHIYDCCTRNSDNLILLSKSGNANKERIWSYTIINTLKKCQGGRD